MFEYSPTLSRQRQAGRRPEGFFVYFAKQLSSVVGAQTIGVEDWSGETWASSWGTEGSQE